MDISKISSQAISAVQTLTSEAATKLAKKIPHSDLPKSRWDFPMPYEVFEAKKNAYLNKLYATYFDEKGKVIPEIKQFLDETIFELQVGGGRSEKKVTSTIKDYIASSIHDKGIISGELYHGSPRPKSILEQGFNPRYISRTNLGPGFYFAGEGEAMQYGSVIVAKIKDDGARSAEADDRFYENLVSKAVARKLSDFLGFVDDFSEESTIQQEFIPKIINEYSRDYIVNDLGVDILRGYGGATPFDYCTCVLNPEIFESIRRH